MKKFTIRLENITDNFLNELINNIDSEYYGMSKNLAIEKMIINTYFGKDKTGGKKDEDSVT